MSEKLGIARLINDWTISITTFLIRDSISNVARRVVVFKKNLIELIGRRNGDSSTLPGADSLPDMGLWCLRDKIRIHMSSSIGPFSWDLVEKIELFFGADALLESQHHAVP